MPKKKTIPPPDDFSSEFMETESAKELSEQQVEAAGSDNTETPLAEPPEVDLGSGDVSGTADVEENELDAENTADAAETVPVSDEKAEDPEYDSILQELNSSTPAPLDSSGENALDALLLEGNVENAPPAEDETESADGEATPQPTAPPAPAGRRDSYILTVDAKDRIETEEERREVIWHEIKTSHIAGRILTGTLDGVEQTPSGRTIVVVDYKGYRIAIPLKEMMLYSGPVPYGAKYKPFMERMNSILATMLTAEIDFIVRGLDNTARSVVASRKAAMLRKRQTFYLDTNEDGVPMIYEGASYRRASLVLRKKSCVWKCSAWSVRFSPAICLPHGSVTPASITASATVFLSVCSPLTAATSTIFASQQISAAFRPPPTRAIWINASCRANMPAE